MSYHVYTASGSGGSAYWADAVDTFALLPITGIIGEAILVKDTGVVYYWTGVAWMPISAGPASIGNLTESTSSVLTITDGTGVLLSNASIEVKKASASQDGYLSSTDFITFNAKQPAGSYEVTTNKGVAGGYASLDSNTLIPITQIPPAALERLVIVADQAARFALTTATVQNGDTVKQVDINEMFFVKDDTQLNNAAGYEVYSAGTASSVAWSGVTGTPTTITGYGITDTVSQPITGFVSGAGTIAATDSIVQAINKLDGNIATKEPVQTKGSISTSTTGVTVSNGISSTVGPNVTVDIATSSSTATGLLTSTDWSTFNAKEPALTKGNISTTTTGMTIANGTSSTVGPNVTVDVATASSTTTGLLTSTDWSTFNNKQAAIGYTTENVANKSTDISLGGLTPSDILYPSQKAAKSYIDANAGSVDIETKTANFTAATKKTYLVDTSSVAISVQLPTPVLNTVITIKDFGFNAHINNITILQAGTEKIEGVAANYVIDSDGSSKIFVSNGTDWAII